MRLLLFALSVAACAPPGPTTLPDGSTPLEPAAGDVEGYLVERSEIDLVCPDGTPARLWVARPDPVPAAAPVAVVFHPGAFDWVDGAADGAPLDGDHLATPSRLDGAFASREVFAALGMWTSAEDAVASRGALAVALASTGAVMLLPENCWGDLWHGEVVADTATGRENDPADGFDRNGFAAARLAWEAATSPGVATALGLALPGSGASEVWLVGQSTGGRAVSELLSDGATPDAVALDSTPDDLGAFLTADQARWGGWADGLSRVFPDGSDTLDDGALSGAPLPDRVAFLWSSQDETWPPGVYDAVLARLATSDRAVVIDTASTAHVASADDPAAAAALVDALSPAAAATARRRSAAVDGWGPDR